MAAIALSPPNISKTAQSPRRQRIVSADLELGLQSLSMAAQHPPADHFELEATLTAIDSRGHVVNALPIHFNQKVATGQSVTLVGADASGELGVTATVLLNPLSIRLDFEWTARQSTTPRARLAPFRFLSALDPPARLGLLLGNESIGEPEPVPKSFGISDQVIEGTRSLAFVQAMTGVEFPMPRELDEEDLRDLHEAEILLAGGTLSGQWDAVTLSLTAIDPRIVASLDGDSQFMIELVAPVVARIAGRDVPLGNATYVFRSVLVDNYRELAEAGSTNDKPLEVRLRPGVGDTYEIQLMTPSNIGLDLQDVRLPIIVPDEVLVTARARGFTNSAPE